MRIARYSIEGQTRYGIVEGDRLRPCDGDPFTRLTPLKSVIDLSAVRLLAPVVPPNIICLGLNYRKHAEETEGQ
jgi:2-keto-4-pentenoate hydratase/2-oxohepta-3-ene-1,7-dioic acid hydratase in catechol pathway